MMRKIGISIWMAVMLIIFPAVVHAHTGLKSSVPAKGETVTEALGAISMEFNTDIEPLSTFELLNEKGEKRSVSDLKIDKNKMSGKLNPALSNGEYTVVWKIVGRDGHPVENKFSFTVKMAEQPASQTPETAAGKEAAGTVQQTPVSESDSSSRGGAAWMIGAVLIAAVALIGLMYVKRAKR